MYSEAACELMSLDDSQLTDRFRELELERRRVTAEMAAVICEGERRGIHNSDGHHSIKGWLRAQANWSNADVAVNCRVAKTLDSVPGAGDALLAGRVGVAQVHELARARSNRRCGAQISDVAPQLLDNAEKLDFESYRVVVRRWELLADLDGAHRTAEQTLEARTASVLELSGGIDLRASGGSALTTAEVQGIFERFVEAEFHIDTAARTEMHGSNAPASLLPRTDAHRRFDAILAIFRKAASTPADAKPPEPVVNIMIDQRSFEELLARHKILPKPDDLDPVALADRRCETAGGMSVPPEEIMQSAMRGWVRRVVFDTDGTVLSFGHRRRLFTGQIRSAVKLMISRCSYPGCNVPSQHGELDHMAEWGRDQGETSAGNADILCGSHNRLKHRRGQYSKREPDGRTIHYRRDGTPILPVGAAPPAGR